MLASLLRIILLTATLKILERGLDKGPIILNQHEGKAPLIRYLAVPVGYRMWTKEQTKLELAGDLIEEVMPLLKDRQVLLLFDSWYAKSSLIERVLQYPGLDIICNVRSDSAMYELPPLPNGKPGRPKK